MNLLDDLQWYWLWERYKSNIDFKMLGDEAKLTHIKQFKNKYKKEERILSTDDMWVDNK